MSRNPPYKDRETYWTYRERKKSRKCVHGKLKKNCSQCRRDKEHGD